MTRSRGYIEWKPQKKAALVVEQIQDILIQNGDYLPLSLRQIFYLGGSAFVWPKTEKYYKSLGDVLTNARRARMIDFQDIRDDGVVRSRTKVWSSHGAILQSFDFHAETFRLDPMASQDRDVVVWTEGRGIVPMVRHFVDSFGLEVVTSGGFDGLTFKKQMADRFSAKAGIVLHIGDFDPSGEVMHNALREDLEAFGADVIFRGADPDNYLR